MISSHQCFVFSLSVHVIIDRTLGNFLSKQIQYRHQGLPVCVVLFQFILPNSCCAMRFDSKMVIGQKLCEGVHDL
ncbi:Uncharacterised protein [Vibrio cholerae]|nr:Uncharacterised protein [Vibrio cholerae]